MVTTVISILKVGTLTQKGHSAKVTSLVSSVVRLESKESIAFKDCPNKGFLPIKLKITDPTQVWEKVLKEMKTFSQDNTLNYMIEDQVLPFPGYHEDGPSQGST